MKSSFNTDLKFKTSDRKPLSMGLKTDYSLDSSTWAPGPEDDGADYERMAESILAVQLREYFTGKTLKDIFQEWGSEKEDLQINAKRAVNEWADENFIPVRLTKVVIELPTLST